MRRWGGAALLTAGLLAVEALSGAATANDTSVAIGVGGLVPATTDKVVMRAEDLSVSPHRVRVRYEFFNPGPADVTMMVAFPLPALALEDLTQRPVDYPFPGDVDFVGFSLQIDGQPIKPAIEAKAFHKGRDVTALLTDLKIPLIPQPNLNILPKATLVKLYQAGLLSDPPDHPEDMITPLWTLKTQFYWTQTFPAGKPVRVEHLYRPVVGLGWFSADDLKPGTYDDGAPHLAQAYCLSSADHAAAAARVKRLAPSGVSAQWMDYILTTARNWHGPIGAFKLTVEAAAPDQLIVSCLPGLRLVAPGRAVLEASQWTPPRDLAVMLLADKGDAVPNNQLIGDSHYRRLEKSELAGRSKAELRLIRNEIYARRGFIFDSADLRDYYSKQPWYLPQSKNVALNAIEQANLSLIQALEK